LKKYHFARKRLVIKKAGKCFKCGKKYPKDKILHGIIFTPNTKRGLKCLECGEMFCYNCYEMIVNRDEGFCKDCFKPLEIIVSIDLSNPSIRLKGIGIVETIDLGKEHVAKKIGSTKETLQYIKTFYENPKHISCPSDAVYMVYERLKDKQDQWKEIDIYFGFMNDKYSYFQIETDSHCVKELWCDTVYLVSKNQVLIQKIYDSLATELDSNDNLIYVDTKKDASNEVTFDEVDIGAFPDKRHSLRLWMD